MPLYKSRQAFYAHGDVRSDSDSPEGKVEGFTMLVL